MERLVALGAVLAYVSVCHTSPQKGATVVVDDGRLGIGLITGGTFGPGSFSIGGSGGGGGGPSKTYVYVNEDDGDSAHIVVQNPSHHRGQQGNRPPQRGSAQPNNSGGGISGITQLYPVKPQTTHIISGQGGMRGEGGSSGSQIYIGTVIVPNNKNNKGNKKINGNKQPVATDASAIEAIFASNGGSNGFPSAENGFASTGSQGSIQIGSITGGNFVEGTGSLNNNKRPGANVPERESTVYNGNIEHSNAGNEALYSIGHGANSNGAGNAGDGYNHGQINSGHNSESSEEPWIWNR